MLWQPQQIYGAVWQTLPAHGWFRGHYSAVAWQVASIIRTWSICGEIGSVQGLESWITLRKFWFSPDFPRDHSPPIKPAASQQTRRLLRKGYLAESVPIFVAGMNGPSAPHVFEFLKREDLGNLAPITAIAFYFTWLQQVSFSHIKVMASQLRTLSGNFQKIRVISCYGRRLSWQANLGKAAMFISQSLLQMFAWVVASLQDVGNMKADWSVC